MSDTNGNSSKGHGPSPQKLAQNSDVTAKPRDLRPLTAKQQLFIDHYLKTWNATESARRAGYNGNNVTLGTVGSQNIRKPQIRATIEKRLKASQLSADQVLSRMAEMANCNVADFLADDGSVDLEKLKAKGYLVKKYKAKRYIEGKGDDAKTVEVEEFEVYDAQNALVNIGKHLKLFGADTTIIIQVFQTFFTSLDEAMDKFVPAENRAAMAGFLKERLAGHVSSRN